LDVKQGILVTRDKLNQLDATLKAIKSENENLQNQEGNFKKDFTNQSFQIQDLQKKGKIIDTEFMNEQILKFGTQIKFEYLLKAAKDTTVTS